MVLLGYAGFEDLGAGGDSGKLRQWMLFFWHPNKPANTDIELMLPRGVPFVTGWWLMMLMMLAIFWKDLHPGCSRSSIGAI